MASFIIHNSAISPEDAREWVAPLLQLLDLPGYYETLQIDSARTNFQVKDVRGGNIIMLGCAAAPQDCILLRDAADTFVTVNMGKFEDLRMIHELARTVWYRTIRTDGSPADRFTTIKRRGRGRIRKAWLSLLQWLRLIPSPRTPAPDDLVVLAAIW